MDTSDSAMFYGGRFVGGRADWMPLGAMARRHQNERFVATVTGGFAFATVTGAMPQRELIWPERIPCFRDLAFPQWEAP